MRPEAGRATRLDFTQWQGSHDQKPDQKRKVKETASALASGRDVTMPLAWTS